MSSNNNRLNRQRNPGNAQIDQMIANAMRGQQQSGALPMVRLEFDGCMIVTQAQPMASGQMMLPGDLPAKLDLAYRARRGDVAALAVCETCQFQIPVVDERNDIIGMYWPTADFQERLTRKIDEAMEAAKPPVPTRDKLTIELPVGVEA